MRYAIWDKTSDIHLNGVDERGKSKYTAQEWIAAKGAWAGLPNVKVIVGGGPINGTVFMEFDATVDAYKHMGAEIEDGMTDEEILQAIEAFEDRPPEAAMPTAEERIAAALEFNNLLQM